MIVECVNVLERAVLTLRGFNARVVTTENAITFKRSQLFGNSVPSAYFLIVCWWTCLFSDLKKNCYHFPD